MTDDAPAIDGYLSAEIHQAEGALSARMDIGIREAAELLRVIARDTGRTLDEAARQVLAERPPAD